MKFKHSRLLCLVLAIIFIMGCAAAPSVAPSPQSSAIQPTAETDGEPKVGDAQFGFTVKDIVPMDALGATGILYEHEKSGAELLFLDCEDINRSFDITFRTPALDDKGKPHVFEHITICGSQKYPDANMFFSVSNQTYNTYVNAYTYHGMTSYPMSSLSEEQLMTMMDYYLSGVFTPLLYTDPKLAQREAWRYELADADAELNIAGTVYSEMQGALTLSAMARLNNVATLYAGSTTAHESGGIPEAVRTLSYDELVAFHDAYYHPSNALITLYGDLDIASFLEYIDSEYLSGYDKKDIDVDMGRVAPYTETKYAEYDFAVEKGAATQNASEIYYSFALNNADMNDTIAISVLSNVILQESSPVMQALREKLPNAQITGNVDFDSPSAPYLSISASGVDPWDRDTLVAAVDEGLAALAVNGISADALDSVVSAYKLSLLTMQEDTSLGVNASLNISLGWTYFDSVAFYPTYEAVLKAITPESATALIKRYFTDNAHRAVSVTKPAAGLTEQNAAALARELSEKKAAMTKDEIAELAARSNEFIEWGGTPASSELVSKLVNIKVADLPEEQRHYDVADETADGVRYMSAQADVSGVLSGRIMLDGKNIPAESLQDVQTVLQLLGVLDTKKHDKEALSTLITRYLSGFSAYLNAAEGYNGTGYCAAEISFVGLTEDAKPSMELLSELLFDTDFSDTATIKNLLTRWSSDFVNDLDNNALTVQLCRCIAMISDYYAYREHVGDYAMAAHERELIALANSDPAALTARLEAARKLILNRFGATVLLTGSDDAIAAYRAGIDDILLAMTNETREALDYSALRLPYRSEGIVVNSPVQMNVLFAGYKGFSGRDTVANMLINDKYMLPRLRNALGAYGAHSSANCVSSMLYTDSDPNLSGSYEIFAKLPEYLRTAQLSQQDVDSYIIGCYSSLSRPLGLLSGAMQTMTDRLLGCSEEMRLQWMREAKATTAKDIAASADSWENVVKNGVRSTSATESSLREAAGLFDVLIYPDGTEEKLSAELAPAA